MSIIEKILTEKKTMKAERMERLVFFEVNMEMLWDLLIEMEKKGMATQLKKEFENVRAAILAGNHRMLKHLTEGFQLYGVEIKYVTGA